MLARLILAFPLLVACATCRRADPDGACITVAATADTHGALFAQELATPDGTLRRFGLSTASGYVAALRQRFGARLLLLDAGDLLHGTLIASLTQGRAAIDAFNALAYDAAAIGNHEFDFGAGAGGGANPTGVLEARLRQARFPFLAANLLLAGGERPRWPGFAPSVLLERAGLRVGVVGVTTVETPRVTKPQNVAHLSFVDPAPAIVAEAERLRARGAQLVILLAHMGGRCAVANDSASCETESELWRTLAALPRGTVDAAIGGHQHTEIAHWVNGLPVLEPGANARQLGWMELCVAPGGGLDAQRSRLHPLVDLCLDEWVDGGCADRPAPTAVRGATFLGQPVAPTPAVERALAGYVELMRREVEAPLGVHLPTPLSLGGTPALEELVCRATAEASGAPIVVHNRGGLRADLPAGPLTFGQAFTVLPFGNQIAVLHLTGAQLTAFVRLLYARRGKPPYQLGLRVEGGDPVQVTLADGTPLAAERRYRVATNDYLAYGGEGTDEAFGPLEPGALEILDQTLLDALITLLRREYPAR